MLKTSQGVKYAPRVKASAIVAGRAYQQGAGMPVMFVLYIAPKYRITPGCSSLTSHRPARVLVDGKLQVGKFYATQTYLEVKE